MEPLHLALLLGHHSTATLFEASGGRPAMDPEIKPLAPGMRVHGPAYTVRADAGDNLAIHRALARAGPGLVMVIATAGGISASYCGGVIAAAARARGLAGLVLDGMVRDSDELRAIGLPIFCRGARHAGASKKAPGELQVRIECGGLAVEPGDFVVGDGDGVLILPEAEAAGVLSRAAARDDREASWLAGLIAGQTTMQLLGLEEPHGQ